MVASQYPIFSLAGGNQYPAVATAAPSQYPVITLVDAQGALVTNVGNGAADGTWINMTLANGFTAGDVAPMYMKDSRNVVHLRGKVVCPGGQMFCWVPPTGYIPLIAATSSIYFDWLAGGSDLVNPSRVAQLTVSGLAVGMTSAAAAGSANTIAALDRLVWQA